ncbi:MAG: hypothetical protein Q7J44_17480 [Pseudotabrizicola sp.]|uniref:hypothetical protein n=1 Tax=Pseudotabrizicola sp. TaxID=2939647 RepID=UPI00272876DC|nr:hypothetical protein [Pseudotabrizicola sp.]MDO9640329.1 hypothetical protein [Pseudotabrizicola sp.]
MSMHGVVIWYSPSSFRAIIWCDDSKELGIASGATAWRNPMLEVQVGDVVAFRTERHGSDRLCTDLHVVESRAAPSPRAEMLAKAETHPVSGIPLLHLCSSRD